MDTGRLVGELEMNICILMEFSLENQVDSTYLIKIHTILTHPEDKSRKKGPKNDSKLILEDIKIQEVHNKEFWEVYNFYIFLLRLTHI